MAVLDGINRRGKSQLFFAGQGIDNSFAMRRQMLSPDYTDRLALDTNSNHQVITGAARGPVNLANRPKRVSARFRVFGKRRFICIKIS